MARLSEDLNAAGGVESWPLLLDFPIPNFPQYGYNEGSMEVSRSFRVAAGDIPALAVICGTIASVADGYLELFGDSIPSRVTTIENQWIDRSDFGLLEYRYVAEQVLAPLMP